MDLPIKNGDVPWFFVCSPEAKFFGLNRPSVRLVACVPFPGKNSIVSLYLSVIRR